MRILDNMAACYGCGACFNVCPTEAIDMRDNEEGFLEPVIDGDKCISCERCKKVCPSLNVQYSNNPEPDIFAFSAEERILYNSSSGGMFTFLAEYVLNTRGYVVGAAYDSSLMVNHVIIHSADELDKIRRSKYLQSSTGDTFRKTKALLEKGEHVLYSGCPCQIAGLLRFLGKDYDTLYTVDLLCHGVPSPRLFQEHLTNSFGGSADVEAVEFRSREGWSTLFQVKLKNGEVKTSYNDKSVYMKSFLQDINLRTSCFQCQYSKLPRQGDITLGDLWAAGSLNLSFEYRKGVSVVLLNNSKGEVLFQNVLSNSEHKFWTQKISGEDVENPCNVNLLNSNIFNPSASNSDIARRRKFFSDCSDKGFESAVYSSLHKFDVGLMLYLSNNYGSMATNYALYRLVTDKGKKAAVIDHLVSMGDVGRNFARKYMKLCSDFMEMGDCQSVNQCFETLVVGSDISWDWILNKWSRPPQYMMLGFADENKRMISYAPSFGSKKGEKDIDKDARALYSHYLKRFDAVSVREDYGVEMCRDLFGIHAKQVMDPVFICNREIWNELSAASQIKFDEEYLLAYILTPMPYKRKAILEAAKNLNKKLVVILDLEVNYEGNKKAMAMDENIVKPGFIDWLAYFQHANYVITDSVHGVWFSIIYRKKFVAIKNRSRERFDSLERLINYPELFFEDSMPLIGKTNIFADIEYDSIYKRLETKRTESAEWLNSALDIEIKPKSDIESIKLMQRLYQSLCEKTELVNQLKRKYSYEEEVTQKINTQLNTGKTWLDVISARNHILPGESKLKNINNLQEFFSTMESLPKYLLILSASDECSQHWRKFLEVSKLQLRKDVGWRESYAAVVDGGMVKADERSVEEININYEFIVGHPKYSVEYVDGELKVGCKPLRYCKVKIKSKGFTGALGACKSEIMVDNIDFSMNKIGINIVVIDKETGHIMDSINVNTYSDPNLRINRV